MLELTEAQKTEYFRRSYTAIDGLWFMKLEAQFGFETALEIDTAVWEVFPKIQARFLKALAGNTSGIQGLYECFVTKHNLEGFEFTTSQKPDGAGFEVMITKCPWYELLVKSNRTQLAEEIGTRICQTEYQVWAAEFGTNIGFALREQLCKGEPACRFCFTANKS